MNIRLAWKGLASRKPSNLLRKSVNYRRKKFYNIGPGPMEKKEVLLFIKHLIDWGLQDIWPKIIWPKIIWPTNIWAQRRLTENHLADRHLSSTTFGQKSFGWKTFGLYDIRPKIIWPKIIWAPWHLAENHLSPTTFGRKSFGQHNLGGLHHLAQKASFYSVLVSTKCLSGKCFFDHKT